MQHSRCAVLFLVAALLALPVRAAAGGAPQGIEDYTIRTWLENDGLSAPRISALEQDQDGYLWLGTDAGVVRFDGGRFVPLDKVGTYKMPDGQISALLSATDHSLWIASPRPYGLLRVDFQDGHVSSYGSDKGLPDGYIATIFEDRARHIWVGSSVGLFRFDGQRWQEDPTPALKSDPVLAMHQSTDGRFWVATKSAVFRRERPDAPFVKVDDIQSASNAWQGFTEDDDGSMWVTDFRQGFRRVGVRTAKVPAQRGWGVQILRDTRDNLWVATRNAGLWRVRNTSDPKQMTVDVITTAQGLATDAVQCVFEDREGNVWLGTQAGLQRLTPNQVQPIAKLPLARSVAITPDGSVWVGSAKGLTRFTADGATRRLYTEDDGMGGSVVLALHADEKGTLWVATENGVSQFRNERFSRITVPADSAVQRVFSIATTSSGVWLRGMARALFKVTPNGQPFVPQELPADIRSQTLTLATDSHDNLWIGATEGHAGVVHPDGRFEKYSLNIGSVNIIYETADGDIWVGGEDGLSRLAHGKVDTLTSKRGLPTHIKSIVEDAHGVLWVGLLTGIARIERHEIDRAFAEPKYVLNYRLLNTADGAAGVPMSDGSPTAVRSNDGRLWFATSAGVTVVDPYTLRDGHAPLRAKVEEVSGDPWVGSSTAERWRREPRDGALALPAHATNVQFLFTAFTLADSRRVQFKYQLEGVDRDWVEAGTARKASYSYVAPGEYRFLVKASGSDNLWSDPAIWTVTVSPAFYQTRWFYALCGVGVLLLLWIVWHLNARRVRHQFALVLAERIRMSRAIHDTLLQGLAGLALQLDDLAHGPEVEAAARGDRLRRIRRRVEDYIREARQSIWDLRSPTLERRAFPDALREVGTRAIADRQVPLDINVKGVPQPCSPVIEQQLLLICQEALTNAVRHGAPRRLDVELEYGGEELRVLVRDDGRGFDLNTVEKLVGHYGVVSMRERAAQVRGRLTIASAPGKGTSVETIIPVH